MKALLDTHAALFAWLAPERLSEAAREVMEDPGNGLLISQVSILEITLKYRIGKLDLPEPPADYLPSRIQRLGLEYVALEDADIYGLTSLPEAHRDPFDWLLVATARRLGIPLLSGDAAMRAYPVEVIW